MSTEPQSIYLWDLYRIFPDAAQKLGFDPDEYDSADAILHKMKGRAASDLIGKICQHAQSVWPWKPTSKQSVVAELQYRYALEQGRRYVSKHTYEALLTWTENEFGLLQGEFRPLVFTRNPSDKEKLEGIINRIPVDLYTARQQFIRQAGAVRGQVNQRLANLREEELQQHQNQEQQENQEQHQEQEQEIGEQLIEEIKEEKEDQKEEKEDQIPKVALEFWNRFVVIREHLELHTVGGGHRFDTLERRPYKAAVGMLVEEIPLEAIFWAMCMHYPETNRRELGITEYDVRTFKPHQRIDGLPPEFPYLNALIRQRIWPWQISVAGVGKTYNVQAMAKHYDQPYCIIPLNLGTSPSVFNGKQKIDGSSGLIEMLDALGKNDEERMTKIAKRAKEDGDVTISEFTKVFRDGGHILLDELDRAVEGILMILNAPLANDLFINTAEGKTYHKHPDTIFWAASNTDGFGTNVGNREYRAANALDFATIDRFRMGRIRMKGDINEYRKDFEQMILARMA